jgi:hypothetical protein
MPSVISKPTQRSISVSFGKTDAGLPFVEIPQKKDSFPAAECERILREHGFRPMTAAMRKKYGKFLRE